MRAIVVDDEMIMLNSFLRLSSGMSDLDVVAQFQNPEDAISYANDHSVDVAFLDVKMPVLNGIELAERLREARPDILIVFISIVRHFSRGTVS